MDGARIVTSIVPLAAYNVSNSKTLISNRLQITANYEKLKPQSGQRKKTT